MKATICAAALLLAALAAAAEAPEPAVQRQVSEDDNVRVEELRVRGLTQRIVVRNKALKGSRGEEYEIVPGTPARDPSQPGSGTGQRVWQLFSF